MKNIEKAGRTVKILGVTNIIYSILIFYALGSSKKELDNIDVFLAIAIIFLSVLTYITGSGIKKNINWAKKTGISLCIISFLNIPVGLIFSIISLYYLARGWNDKLDEGTESIEHEIINAEDVKKEEEEIEEEDKEQIDPHNLENDKSSQSDEKEQKSNSEKKEIVPNNKLRKNERVLYTVGVATTGYFFTSESGQLFLTNQRLFSEKLISDDVAYSFELSEINDCRKGIFIAFPLFPWGCAKLIDKNGMVIKEVMCGFAGLQSKILVEELNKALGNYTPVVEEKVKESNESDESPKDKLTKLNELKEEGLISEDDFNSKKEEILKEI